MFNYICTSETRKHPSESRERKQELKLCVVCDRNKKGQGVTGVEEIEKMIVEKNKLELLV